MAKEKYPLTGTESAFNQFFKGWDYEPPERIIADIPAEKAVIVPPGCPNSIATQVAHMIFWDQRWLGRIAGEPDPPRLAKNADFPSVKAEEWEGMRARFIAGLKKARAISKKHEDYGRRHPSGFSVEQLLLQIALHDTYHLGQISIYRQLLGIWPPEGSGESW